MKNEQLQQEVKQLIENYLETKKVSAKKLAEHIGVSNGTISNIMNEVWERVNDSMLLKIKSFFKVKNWVLVNTQNFLIIQEACDRARQTRVMSGIVGFAGAGKTTAIDIDEWSIENSKENALRNQVDLEIQLGTAENLGKENFDIILANINRNILISDIPTYVSVLNDGGNLLLSGLCFFDVEDILEVCTAQNLTLKNKIQQEEWVSLLLEKSSI